LHELVAGARRALAHIVIGLLVGCTSALYPTARAQPVGLLQIEDETHAFLERQQALGHLTDALLGAKPLSADEPGSYLDSLAAREGDLIPRDRAPLRQLRGDEVGGLLGGRVRSAFPILYRDGRAVLSASGDGWRLAAEPLAVLSFGPVRQTARAGQDGGGGQEAWARGYRRTRGDRGAGHISAVPGRHVF